MTRELDHYMLTVTAGPGIHTVVVVVIYFDVQGEVIGEFFDGAMAFGYTWRDVARIIRTGAKKHGIDRDPCHTDSPHVDLT